ncbi:MAG: hypothetical protein PHU03_03445 [Syntrophales bacterium]|nr:hypothetical protein [Syntrophales bacterium]
MERAEWNRVVRVPTEFLPVRNNIMFEREHEDRKKRGMLFYGGSIR